MVLIGIIVDNAKEVISFNPEQIEQPPKMGIFVDNKYLQGPGKVENDFGIIF